MQTEAKQRAKEILADLFSDELRELRIIEEEREREIQRGQALEAELRDSEAAVESIRASLAKLPDRLSAAMLAADHLETAAIQDRFARLRTELEAAQSREKAAREAFEREAITPLRAAQNASGRAYAVRTRAEALRDAVQEELEAALEPVQEGSRRASAEAEVFQSYGGR